MTIWVDPVVIEDIRQIIQSKAIKNTVVPGVVLQDRRDTRFPSVRVVGHGHTLTRSVIHNRSNLGADEKLYVRNRCRQD